MYLLAIKEEEKKSLILWVSDNDVRSRILELYWTAKLIPVLSVQAKRRPEKSLVITLAYTQANGPHVLLYLSV